MSDDRDRAPSVLAGLLADAMSGQGRTTTLAGTVGTGKSLLLNTFAGQAVATGALTLVGYGSRAERDLPLGLMSQLLRDAPLSLPVRERLRGLCSRAGRPSRAASAGDGADAELSAFDVTVMHEIGTVLLNLSERCPLAIVVDDAHQADEASLRCLAYLCRRARYANMLILMSYSEFDPLQDDLVNLPQHTRLRLTPMSPEAVGRLLAERAGAAFAKRHTADWHQLTGGSPLLLTGLFEDHAAAGENAVAGDVAGPGYGRAVLRAVRSGGPELLKVVQALALSADPRYATALSEVENKTAGRFLHSLCTAGILHQGTFRHQAARDSVLADMDGRRRAELHRRAAFLAHERGAGSAVIAEHLRQAPTVDKSWAAAALADAARVALRDGAVDRGLELLECVSRLRADPVRRNEVTALQLRARWRVNPAMASDLIGRLLAGHDRGELRGADAVVLVRALLWHGRFEEARAVLGTLSTAADGDAETLAELAVLRPWLRATYPTLRDAVAQPPTEATLPVTTLASSRLNAVTLLGRVLDQGPARETAAAALRILRGVHLDEMTLDTAESALLALVYGGRAADALPGCDRFVEEARLGSAPARQARLLSVRAEIAVRLGDLRGAQDHARAALDLMPSRNWGTGLGAPLSSLILAGTAMGEYRTVQGYLEEPVPDGMFQTRSGLLYLHARARYSLATGHRKLALRDLTRCGELTAEWGIDTSGLVAWRNDVAETYLAMGRAEPAAKLVKEQIDRSTHLPRVAGVAMRLLAATTAARKRPTVLRRSIDLLQLSGDRYELARTLVDLTDAHEALGESRRAAIANRQARRLAQECQVTLGGAECDDTPAAPSTPSLAELLSEAERRVAELAAIGYTNREISDKLYVTPSTVEQHLTRVYRKLGVSSRSELASLLDTDETDRLVIA
ncbi:helix-turn-helix transcriptional regulator [Jidongwangia harbinensis]|uniref:helix-turn-helix transcriptional regulator n=1 Tax=Jidongwangia harbinensis TaxID=2878561 RepID=UPI001CD99E6C|nr:helix-turn-helix transcriptional regulator [Jidongwangia harbinensis]MCA2219075.1 LuxR C-terminal-related transcriptional regulator [Jidongwangia harbinensis]